MRSVQPNTKWMRLSVLVRALGHNGNDFRPQDLVQLVISRSQKLSLLLERVISQSMAG